MELGGYYPSERTGLDLVAGLLSSARVLGMFILLAECVGVEKGGRPGDTVYTDWTAVSTKVLSGRGLSIRAESARLRIVELVVFSSPGFFHRAAVSWPSYQMSMALIGTRSF